jgi:hypothetical protein
MFFFARNSFNLVFVEPFHRHACDEQFYLLIFRRFTCVSFLYEESSVPTNSKPIIKAVSVLCHVLVES